MLEEKVKSVRAVLLPRGAASAVRNNAETHDRAGLSLR